ncbi:MAG: hypothetical protein ACHQJ6_02580 [Candidatus Berkiellales bacterium]
MLLVIVTDEVKFAIIATLGPDVNGRWHDCSNGGQKGSQNGSQNKTINGL